MLYIKNYRSINEQVQQNRFIITQKIFSPLLFKPIIVFTDSGGASGNGFSGILAGVCHDRIELMTACPRQLNKAYKFNNCSNRINRNIETKTVIYYKHIVAIAYNQR